MLFITSFNFKDETVDICDTEDSTIETLPIQDVYRANLEVVGLLYNYKHERPSFYSIKFENKSLIPRIEQVLNRFNGNIEYLYSTIRNSETRSFVADGLVLSVQGSSILVKVSS